MSDAYERERQNNSRLSELSAKVTALRGVTVDIYDNARSQDVIDNTVCIVLCSVFPFVVLSASSTHFLERIQRMDVHRRARDGTGKQIGALGTWC